MHFSHLDLITRSQRHAQWAEWCTNYMMFYLWNLIYVFVNALATVWIITEVPINKHYNMLCFPLFAWLKTWTWRWLIYCFNKDTEITQSHDVSKRLHKHICTHTHYLFKRFQESSTQLISSSEVNVCDFRCSHFEFLENICVFLLCVWFN